MFTKLLLRCSCTAVAARRWRGRPTSPAFRKSAKATRSRSATPESGSAASTRPRSTSSASTPRANAGPAASPRATNWSKHVEQQELDLPHPPATDRRGRIVARCEVDGEDIQKWLVRNGWALAYVARLPRLRRRREGRARGQGRDVAGRVHRAVGLARPQQEDDHSRRRQAARRTPMRSCWHRRPARSRPRPTAPSRATSTRSGECIYHQPTSRWYAQDQDENQQGHALVLLGRRGRSRRLPRDQAIAAAWSR